MTLDRLLKRWREADPVGYSEAAFEASRAYVDAGVLYARNNPVNPAAHRSAASYALLKARVAREREAAEAAAFCAVAARYGRWPRG